MDKYICYEPDFKGKSNTVKSEQKWKEDYEKHGDKENFSDADSWFLEMVFCQILHKIQA